MLEPSPSTTSLATSVSEMILPVPEYFLVSRMPQFLDGYYPSSQEGMAIMQMQAEPFGKYQGR